MSAELSRLNTQVRQLAEHQPFRVHWQISRVGAGDQQCTSIGQGEHTQLASFSTRKVSLLLACLALVHRGDLALDQRLVITEALKDGVQAGIMKDLAPGVALSLEDHLRQMMITSDNICTQLVFHAINQATGDALQWVNDYCSWVGLDATIHREIFPRSGDLDWHHSIEHMTVTTAADQAKLLQLLGRATYDERAADSLFMSQDLCRFAIRLMTKIYTPLLGASTSTMSFAEKNGRGLRGLSQIGLALDSDGAPAAAVAVFAEQISTQLPSGTPGRLAAYELFASIGQAVETWHLQTQPPAPGKAQATRPKQAAFFSATLKDSTTTPQQTREPTTRHPLAGVGKLFAALAIAEAATENPQLLDAAVTITGAHRGQAGVGPLRTLTGELTMSLGDAVGLIISTGDAAVSLALRDSLVQRSYDLLGESRRFVEKLSLCAPGLDQTVITGQEKPQNATGDLLEGLTSPQDLARLLAGLAQAGGLTGPQASSCSSGEVRRSLGISRAAAQRVLGWMSHVFEPSGLAYGLPGFGPTKVPQWSVSGMELRVRAPEHGWASVLITRPEAEDSGAELAVAAAFLPRGREAGPAPAGRPSQSLGALGLAAYQACGKIGSTEYRPRP